KARDVRRVDEAPLPVAPLRPGIGIKQIDPADRVLRQPVERVDRVGGMEPDIADLPRVDRRQRLGHAVDERLAADEADARIAKRLRDQGLTAAEADLEAGGIDRAWKQRGEIVRGCDQVYSEAWQQRVEQFSLVRAQGVPL